MLIFDFRKVGNKLHAARKRLGMTQAEVAEVAGLSDRTYADIERGTVNMRIETMLRICLALQITPDEIFTDTKEMLYQQGEIGARLMACTQKEKEAALKILSAYLQSLE